MTEEKKIVMAESDEAAHWQDGISGWIDRHGHYWGSQDGDERTARYAGSTHRCCVECGEPVEKGWMLCERCKGKKDIEEYNAMPKMEWDGETPLYSDRLDKFFFDSDNLDDYEQEEGNLRLIICEPEYLPLIESDFGCDELPEEGELSDAVWQAIKEFNEVIRDNGPVSWHPGKYAVMGIGIPIDENSSQATNV